MQKSKNIVVIGGGITGLTATYYLQKTIIENQLPYRIQLLEARERLGGKINTLRKDSLIIERGADSFLGRKKHALELVDDLGLTDQLVRNKVGQAYILFNDQLHPIPEGSFMGIPTQPLPLLQSKLLSWRGKGRLMFDLFLAKSKNKRDHSLGYFLRRRLGNEIVDRLIEPLLSGVYSSDIDQMSLMATFPSFLHLEQQKGSIIKGLRQSMPKSRRNTGKRPGQFFTFKNGLKTLIDEMVRHIGQEKVYLKTKVKHIQQSESRFKIYTSKGQIQADACLITIPHQGIPSLFHYDASLKPLKEIPVSSVANVVFGFQEDDVVHQKQSTGFVVSRKSPYHITACTLTSEKWPHTTPSGMVLLRAYVGKPTEQEIVSLSDEAIVQKALADLKRVFHIKNKPLFSYVTRYKDLMPQYTVDHQKRLEFLENSLKNNLPGVFLSGSSYQGVGIPDCIKQAKDISHKILEYLVKER